jgi:hypothetical protein
VRHRGYARVPGERQIGRISLADAKCAWYEFALVIGQLRIVIKARVGVGTTV